MTMTVDGSIHNYRNGKLASGLISFHKIMCNVVSTRPILYCLPVNVVNAILLTAPSAPVKT